MLLAKAQEKLLKKNHLETAMDSVGLKHVTRDTVDDLCKKITTSWPRTRREIKPSQTGAKRLQTADAPDAQVKKKSKAGGAVDDAVSNVLVVDGESGGEGAESSVDDAAPRHMQAKASVSSERGGSSETAALSGEREERFRDKKKHEGEALLVPDDGKTRKTGPKCTEAGADGQGYQIPDVPISSAVDQTIWAHLEFEDGQIVPLKNLSTSAQDPFVIGRDEKVVHHVARDEYVNENGKGCRISGRHCNIRRLDDLRVVVQVVQKQSKKNC
jgi:hypothetical protein